MENKQEKLGKFVAVLVAVGLTVALPGLVKAQAGSPETRKKLAVLNLRTADPDITAKQLAELSAVVREVVYRELKGERYDLATEDRVREATGEVKCDGDKKKCNLEVARKLGVDVFVSGEIIKDGSTYLHLLRMTRVSEEAESLGVKAGQPVDSISAIGKALARTAARLAGLLSKAGTQDSSKSAVAQPAPEEPDICDCARPHRGASKLKRVMAGGNCLEMEEFLEKYKVCRRVLKRRWRRIGERCKSTGNEVDCAEERDAGFAYEDEVELYRTLVMHMRDLRCSGAPR